MLQVLYGDLASCEIGTKMCGNRMHGTPRRESRSSLWTVRRKEGESRSAHQQRVIEISLRQRHTAGDELLIKRRRV